MSFPVRSVLRCVTGINVPLTRGFFGINLNPSIRKQQKEAKEMLDVFVDPLSKSELKYIPKQNVFLAESIGVEYPIRDGIYVMSPNEATLIVKEEK